MYTQVMSAGGSLRIMSASCALKMDSPVLDRNIFS